MVYNGMAEPSKVPAEWFGWLHHSTSVIPLNIDTHKFSWQKIHLPNLTGTKNSYSPRKSTKQKTSSQYQAWNPNHE